MKIISNNGLVCLSFLDLITIDANELAFTRFVNHLGQLLLQGRRDEDRVDGVNDSVTGRGISNGYGSVSTDNDSTFLKQ